MKIKIGNIFFIILSTLLMTACTSPAPAPAPIPANSNFESTSTGSNPVFLNETPVSLTQTPKTTELIDYTHKKNLFRIEYPVNWKVDEQESFASFTAPDESGFIQATVVNTGIELNDVGFANFVDTTEEYSFAKYKNYSQLEKTADNKKGVATIRSILDSNKISQKILSYYQRQGSFIFYLHFWSNADAFATYSPLYEQIIQTSHFDSTSAAKSIPYSIVYAFNGPKNLFVIDIPINWNHQVFQRENTIQDTFISPDGHAKIQNITYDDGKIVTRGEADRIALELLKELYAKDVRISEAKTQPDLSIRWTWTSRNKSIEGTSFYETRGTSFLMLTLWCDKGFKNIFNPLFNLIIEKYQPPE